MMILAPKSPRKIIIDFHNFYIKKYYYKRPKKKKFFAMYQKSPSRRGKGGLYLVILILRVDISAHKNIIALSYKKSLAH